MPFNFRIDLIIINKNCCILGFPNHAVVEAYMNPEVNRSREKFSWSSPDIEALRDYLYEKIGWNREKFNGIVVPVLDKFNSAEVRDFHFALSFR